MNKLFYPKLAASGLKKNRRLYIPYLLTCIFTVAMFYIVKSLSLNPGLSDMVGDATMTFTMKFGCVVIGLFALIFLFYTNSFLMKQRKKEFGLFHILGMEKHHLYRLIAWENLYAAIFTLTAGLLFGIALDKAMFLLVSRMIGGEIPLGFFLSPRAVVETMVLFLGIYTLIFLNALRQIKTANPIELLHAGNMGEKEPKAKWFMAILGLLCTGAGY
ncbi:ABC transporter permease [Blautia sp.]|nr:ABC transporter permease [Blautia sp.]MEE0811481.1 ABC transporter permease [Blautia sp.]